MKRALIAAVLAAGACARSPQPGDATNAEAPPLDAAATNGAGPTTGNSAERTAPTTEKPALHAKLDWIKDDVPAAMTKAKADGKLVFVDAWAPWCHTCLSMKNYVFVDPSLRELGDSVVFAAIDTDRDENAAFVDKYAIDVWPTFFVIEPASGEVLGYWPGAASVREMDAFIREGIAARDARRAAKLDPESPLALLLAAKAAHAQSEYDKAAGLYGRAVAKAPRDFPRRSEALVGQLSSTYNAGRADACLKIGLAHYKEVEGAARPTDFARTLLACVEHVKDGKKVADARQKMLEHMKAIAASPHPESTADDRADTLEAIADIHEELGDRAAARAALEERLKILEKAAAAAPSPSAASTFDYARANTYLALGRANDAVKMLSEREKQLPDSYEPPARLASVLAALKKYPEALAAIDRALAHAYGPRRLRYLETKAGIQAKLGDFAGQLKTLEEEVAGYEAHAKRQAAKPQRLETAKKRLAAAKRALATAKTRAP